MRRRMIQNQMALVAAATAFCAARPELKSADLFVLAEKMEAGVGR